MNDENTLNRREFLQGSTLGVVGAHMLPRRTTGKEKIEAPAETAKIKEYRVLGRTGFKVSDISAGTGLVYSEPSIISALLDGGVNYIDTGEGYANGGAERNVGEVMKRRDRKSAFITTKLVLSKDRSKEGIVARARKCLERLQTDYVNCIMIHAAQEPETLRTPGFHEAMDELKKEGRVRFLGISNHGNSWRSTTAESMENTLLAAAEDGRFDVMLFAYNYLAREIGEKILTACAEKNIGTTLMKTDPVGRYYEMKREIEEVTREGGPIPAYIQRELPKHEEKFAQAQSFLKEHNLNSFEEVRPAAIRFVLSNENVNTVCLTFRNFDYVKLGLGLSGSRFNDADEETLSAFARGCGALYCRHACGLCESRCPHGVPVNTVMRYNHYFEAQGCEKFAMTQYADLPTSKADRCGGCDGYCAEACPYGVPVPALLTLAHRRLTFA